MSFEALVRSPMQEARQACEFLGKTPPRGLDERIKGCFDPTLPTEHFIASGSDEQHRTTALIQQCLNGGAERRLAPPEQELLPTEMANVLADSRAPLQLNNLYPQNQTLLPKLRITIVTAELQGWNGGGGIGSAYLELALALASAGHPVRVLLVAAGRYQPSETPPRITVEPLDPSGLSRLELSRLIAKHLGNDPGDVIHMHDWLGLGSGLKQALGSECPTLIVGLHGPSSWTRSYNQWPRKAAGGLAVSVESLYSEGLMQALERDLIQHADLLVAPSNFMAAWVKEHLLQAQNAPELAVQRNCALSRNRLKHDADRKSSDVRPLIYFGRLEERKGLLLFLEALEFLPTRPSKVVFLGGDCLIREGRKGSEIAKERLEILNIPCHFLSNLQRSEALNKLQELQGVAAIPSLVENSPCVVEELLDSGLQVVTTNVGGTREFVAPESETWLSEPEAEAFAQHLQRALTTSSCSDYQLKARLPGWQIALSWQAFHERLPRRHPAKPPAADPTSQVQRGLRFVRRAAGTAFRIILYKFR